MVSLFEPCARIPTLRHLPFGFGGLNITLLEYSIRPPDLIRFYPHFISSYPNSLCCDHLCCVPRMLVWLI